MIFFCLLVLNLEGLHLFLVVLSNKAKLPGLPMLVNFTLLFLTINNISCLHKDSELCEGMYLVFFCLQRLLGRLRFFKPNFKQTTNWTIYHVVSYNLCYKMLLTHLNSSVCNCSLYVDLYKGLGLNLICTGPSEFAHNSPNAWQNVVRVEAAVVESWVWCGWCDGTAWELTPEQASPGWRTVFCSHGVEHPARCLKAHLLEFRTHLASWSSLDLSACLISWSQ